MDLVKVIREVQRKKAERERLKNQAFCPFCEKQVRLITIREATEVYQMTLDEITEYAAESVFHRIRSSSGETLFCQNSLHRFESQTQATQPMRLEFLQSLGIA